MPQNINIYQVLPHGQAVWQAKMKGKDEVLLEDEQRDKVLAGLKEIARIGEGNYYKIEVYNRDGTLDLESFLW